MPSDTDECRWTIIRLPNSAGNDSLVGAGNFGFGGSFQFRTQRMPSLVTATVWGTKARPPVSSPKPRRLCCLFHNVMIRSVIAITELPQCASLCVNRFSVTIMQRYNLANEAGAASLLHRPAVACQSARLPEEAEGEGRSFKQTNLVKRLEGPPRVSGLCVCNIRRG
jgi:hypothetical protein